MGHIAEDCPEKKSRESSGGSSGGLAMMCLEDVQSLVEEDPKPISDEDQAQLNSEVNSEENDSEQRSEQILILQDWINYAVQLTMTEEQSCTNQVGLDQSCATVEISVFLNLPLGRRRKSRKINSNHT